MSAHELTVIWPTYFAATRDQEQASSRDEFDAELDQMERGPGR